MLRRKKILPSSWLKEVEIDTEVITVKIRLHISGVLQ